MTNTGKVIWTYSGITGHYNVPFDINGDGKDEMFTVTLSWIKQES